MNHKGTGQPVIVVHLMGGLGNQMFQYAFGRRMALHNSGRLVLDISGYPQGGTPNARKGERGVGLSHFRIAGELTADPYADRTGHVEFRRWFRKSLARAHWLADSKKPYFLRHQIVEPSSQQFCFDARVLNVKVRASVSVRGFWQSQSYFLDVEESIRDELALRDELRGTDAEIAGRIRATNSVAIHVRHGDNANAVAPALGVLPREYYRSAIEEMLREVKGPEFFVFSDDSAWSRQVMPGDAHPNFVDHNGPTRSHEDLRLMSLCKHHILANSTFGWWGAWLGKRPGQVVIAPRRYYLGADRPNPDLYPPGWRLM